MDALEKELLHSLTAKGWKRIGVRQHHGINFPLGALHSDKSCGVGEFYDLIPLIDWCQRLKIDFIQLLPLNDSGGDSSPYNAISSCALNVIYLSLHALPQIEHYPELKAELQEFAPLNETQRLDYEKVLTRKLNWLRKYFARVGAEMIKGKQVQRFIANHHWVLPYSYFKFTYERFKGETWKKWPQECRGLSSETIKELAMQNWAEVSFYVFLQFLCAEQLKSVKKYANDKGVFLVGDFPFLMSSESADVWQFPEYFDLELSGGAPPDYYAPEGQNWGFPVYRWDRLREQNFSWWKQRLQYAQNFYDLIRLDHVVGFFRIWAVPFKHSAKEGHFIPEDESQWEVQGVELLTMIAQSTSMLPIAEDLGTVPPMVRLKLCEMGICGTKVMRWERKWEEDKRFIPIQYYSPVSITCLSTHDSETLSLWWRDLPQEAKEYAEFKHWNYAPQLTDRQREEILWDSHHTSSLLHGNLLQEYLAFFPDLTWADPEDERINIPGEMLSKNWTYRIKPTVETLTSHKDLFTKMEKIIFSATPPSEN